MTDLQDKAYLEHYGKKGMKWGVRRQKAAIAAAKARKTNPDRTGNRNNDKYQKTIDQYRRAASGKATKTDTLILGAFKIPVVDLIAGGGVQGASQNILDRNQKSQRKIKAGKSRITDKLNRAGGIDVRELNFKYTEPKF